MTESHGLRDNTFFRDFAPFPYRDRVQRGTVIQPVATIWTLGASGFFRSVLANDVQSAGGLTVTLASEHIDQSALEFRFSAVLVEGMDTLWTSNYASSRKH